MRISKRECPLLRDTLERVDLGGRDRFIASFAPIDSAGYINLFAIPSNMVDGAKDAMNRSVPCHRVLARVIVGTKDAMNRSL